MTVHEPELRPAEIPSAAADPTEASGILTIDLGAVAANWKTLASMTVPVECAAVVKGDGYGCGLEPVTHTLSRAGHRTLFVADLAERATARAGHRDWKRTHLNSSHVELSYTVSFFRKKKRITFVISSLIHTA